MPANNVGKQRADGRKFGRRFARHGVPTVRGFIDIGMRTGRTVMIRRPIRIFIGRMGVEQACRDICLLTACIVPHASGPTHACTWLRGGRALGCVTSCRRRVASLNPMGVEGVWG